MHHLLSSLPATAGIVLGLIAVLTTGSPTVAAQIAAVGTGPETRKEYDFKAVVGPHHSIIGTMLPDGDAHGGPIQRPSRYTEVATGLNYQDSNGLWQRTVEKIEPHPKGAAALNGYYTVIFGKNIHRAGAIELTLPGGQKQKNHPLGLYYVDRTDGKWVQLSGIKDSEGTIIPPNRVLYRDAFDSIRGDIMYTYQKGRFEADAGGTGE